MVVLCGFLTYKLAFRDPATKVVLRGSKDVINEAKTEAKIIARSVDKQGYSKTVAKQADAILSNGDISLLPVSPSVFDSLRLDNIAKGARLQQASAIIAKLEAKDLRATRVIDSMQRESFVYSDDFAKAVFTPDSLGGKFDIAWRLKLIKQDYKKRNNFLSPYTYYTDILSPDPRITIGDLQALTIESHKPTKWGIGLQGGYYYDPAQRRFLPAIGLGLSYNLIRF